MWQKNIKRTVFTLNLNPDRYKDITDITYPLMKKFCHKIGAEFYEITERKFPDYPPSYEKVQVYKLGQDMQNDWNIFFDCDTLINPNTPDFTLYIPRDHCAHNAHDPAFLRWKFDRFLHRDGRNIGSCTWCCIASDYTIELFKPCYDLTLKEIESNIFPLQSEIITNMVPPIRLIEDYIFSRNIAKYGLKFTNLLTVFGNLGFQQQDFFHHMYATPIEEKVIRMKETLKRWLVE